MSSTAFEKQSVRRKGRLHEICPARQPQPGQEDNVSDKVHGDTGVDIIAVHGLGSKYETTWALKLKDGSRYHWLKERLGPDVPKARILGHEYGSEWYGDPAYTNLEECGTELLHCIIRDRQHHGRIEMCPTRRKQPIIFIAHSFGGLVVKQALVTAYQRWKDRETRRESPSTESVWRAEAANYRDFLCSVAGVIFLGTPHRGASFSYWANAKMKFGLLMGRQSHPELIKVLQADSEPLEKLQQAFDEVCNDPKVLAIRPRCYRETRHVPLPPWIVVRARSAWLDNAENGSLDANHMDMNTFQPGPDANYDKILSDIRVISASASRSVTRRLERWKYGSILAEDDRNVVEHWLDPSRKPQLQQFQAKLSCQKAAPYTCQWLQKLDVYKDWVSGKTRENVLWIHGKPASGKSVLAAYIINVLRDSSRAEEGPKFSPCYNPLSSPTCGSRTVKPTVLYFLCGIDRSHDRPEGVLGTLIHQLLSLHDTDEVMFAKAYQWKEARPTTGVNADTLLHLLRELLSLVIGTVYIIVDGLDDSTRLSDCLDTLLTIAMSSAANTRLLLLSQRQESIRNALDPNVAVLDFPITNHTLHDITQYVEYRTLEMINRRPALEPKRSDITQALQVQAQGMFEFVNIAIHNLEKHVACTEDIDEYLANLPSGLTGVYDKIFTRLSQSSEDIKARIRTAVQILAVTAVPITVLDLHTALRTSETMGKESRDRAWWSRWSETTADDASRELKLLLDSLIEIDTNQVVRLVHSSLRQTVLLKQAASWDGSRTGTSSWYQFTAAEAHLLLSQICVIVSGNTTMCQANVFAPIKPPLVAYAWNYWAYHWRASEATLANKDSRVVFDRMLRQVHRHTLSFLYALGDFTIRHLDPVEGNYTLLEYRRSLQQAQDALSSAINSLCLSRQAIPLAAKLHDSRELVPYDTADVPAEGPYRKFMKKAGSVMSDLRAQLLNGKTQVERVKLDDLVEKTSIGEIFHNEYPYPAHVSILLDSSRSLRLLALSLSVNPIYGVLTQKANAAGFSPINLLVYVAQLLEEAASFPYWHHLPEILDPADAFLCSDSDPQAEPAKFVLRSVDWQKPNRRLADSEHKARSEQSKNTISDKLSRQVRELTEVEGSNWVATRYAMRIIWSEGDDEDSWFRSLVANPLVNLHLKETFFMLQGNEDPWPLFLNPEAMLDLRSPSNIRNTPVKEIIAALPSLLKILFVRYVSALLQVVAGIPRAALVAHYVQLIVSKPELIESARYFRQLLQRRPPVLRHVLGVVLLYLFRKLCFPWLGAHAMVHPWADLVLAYRDPSAYLGMQSGIDAKFWLRYTILMRLYHASGRACVTHSLDDDPRLPKSPYVATLATFYNILSIERNIFGLCFTTAVLTAAARVIMYEPDNVGAIAGLTYLIVITNTFSILNLTTGAVLQQKRASFLQGLPFVIFQFVMLIAAINYQRTLLALLLKALLWFLWPVTASLAALWKMGLYAYAPLLKFCGVVCSVLLVFLAVDLLNNAIHDPHNLEGSRRAVHHALDNIRSLRDKPEQLVLGQFPFGPKSVPSALTGPGDRHSSGEDSWTWPDDDTGSQDKNASSTDPPQQSAIPGKPADSLARFGQIVSSELEKEFRQIIKILQSARSNGIAGFGRNVINSNGFSDPQPDGWSAQIGAPQQTSSMRDRLGLGRDSHQMLSGNEWHMQDHLGLPASQWSSHRTFHTSTFDDFGQPFSDMSWRHGVRPMLRDDGDQFVSRVVTHTREVHETRSTSSWNFSFQTPGSTVVYSSTQGGSPGWADRIFWFAIPLYILAIFLFIMWSWWTADAVTEEGSTWNGVPVQRSCWRFGIPMGPVFVGYGCDGFIFEVFGFSF